MCASAGKRWKGDSEDRATAASVVSQLALMLTDDPVRHEQAKPCTRLLGGEVRFEKMVTIVVGDPGSVVRNAEERPSVVSPTCCQLNMSMRRRSVNRVIDQVGDDLPEQQRIRSYFHCLRRLA